MFEQYVSAGKRWCLQFGANLTACPSYHLGLKPGQAVLDTIGGAHKLQGWNHNILTDSGGLVLCTIRRKKSSDLTVIDSRWFHF